MDMTGLCCASSSRGDGSCVRAGAALLCSPMFTAGICSSPHPAGCPPSCPPRLSPTHRGLLLLSEAEQGAQGWLRVCGTAMGCG